MRSKARWYTGIGAVTIGVATLLSQQLLPALGLRPLINAGLSGAAALAVVLVGLWRSHVADDATRQELRARLDRGLACWPPRTADQLTPYALGAHPVDATPSSTGEVLPEYVRREVDDDLRSAIGHDPVVVVYGPKRAGKTRSAYEALRYAQPELMLLVPEDAAGLETTLAHIDALPALIESPPGWRRQLVPRRLAQALRARLSRMSSGGSKPRRQAYVLWLDELGRFLPGLDIDVLDQLAARGAPLPIVATIDEHELAPLLDDPATEAQQTSRHRARRLLARARAIRVTAPSRDERAVSAALAQALAGHPWHGWFPAPVPPVQPAPRPARVTAMMGAVGALMLACALMTVAYGRARGFKTPPDIQRQLADIRDSGPDCEHARASPANARAITGRTVVVLAVRRALCPGPDEVRLYHKRADQLVSFTTLRLPANGPRRAFTCVGVTRKDPCAVTDENDARIVVGAFDDPSTHQAVPFALEPAGERLNLVSLGRRPPRAGPQLNRAGLRADARTVILALDGEPDGRGCARRERCVIGYGAQAWAAFPHRGSDPAMVVAGYLARGSRPEAPRELRMRAWRLVSRRDVPVLGQRCRIFDDGARVPLVAHVSGSNVADAMAGEWRRLSESGAKAPPGIVC